MQIINCTPHPVVLLSSDSAIFDEKTRHYSIGNFIRVLERFEPSGIIPRCKQSEELCGDVNGTPIYHMVFGEVSELPEPEIDTMYIVSNLVAQACPNRNDLIMPAHIVRNAEGQVIGCLAFATVYKP